MKFCFLLCHRSSTPGFIYYCLCMLQDLARVTLWVHFLTRFVSDIPPGKPLSVEQTNVTQKVRITAYSDDSTMNALCRTARHSFVGYAHKCNTTSMNHGPRTLTGPRFSVTKRLTLSRRLALKWKAVDWWTLALNLINNPQHVSEQWTDYAGDVAAAYNG